MPFLLRPGGGQLVLGPKEEIELVRHSVTGERHCLWWCACDCANRGGGAHLRRRHSKTRKAKRAWNKRDMGQTCPGTDGRCNLAWETPQKLRKITRPRGWTGEKQLSSSSRNLFLEPLVCVPTEPCPAPTSRFRFWWRCTVILWGLRALAHRDRGARVTTKGHGEASSTDTNPRHSTCLDLFTCAL